MMRTVGRSRPRVWVVILVAISLLVGVTAAAQAKVLPVAAAKVAAAPAAPQPGDSGASADLAITGYGDGSGYHLDVGRESAGFAWREIADLQPGGIDAPSWTGYQCVSGDGRFAAVAVLPISEVNQEAARDHGAFAYSVNLSTGQVRPVATGVGLTYFSPGCGIGDNAVFSLYPGTGQTSTQLLTANLATGTVASAVTVTGQLSSAVPTASGPVAALGPNLVSVAAGGKTSVLAAVGGQPFDLRPAADGGVNLLDAHAGSVTSAALHEHAGAVTSLGSGPLDRMQLFGGANGRAVLSGAATTTPGELAVSGVRAVSDAGLAHGAESSSLDGDALLGAAAKASVTTPAVLSTRTGKSSPTRKPPLAASRTRPLPRTTRRGLPSTRRPRPRARSGPDRARRVPGRRRRRIPPPS